MQNAFGLRYKSMKFNGIELEPGCLVKLKNKRGNYWNVEGKMDRYIDRIVTISKISSEDGGDWFQIIQDLGDSENNWIFGIEDIQEVVSIPLHEDQIATCNFNASAISSLDYISTGQIIYPESTAILKIGNLEINVRDKTFTKKQIKNWKKYFGVEVINLKSDK